MNMIHTALLTHRIPNSMLRKARRHTQIDIERKLPARAHNLHHLLRLRLRFLDLTFIEPGVHKEVSDRGGVFRPGVDFGEQGGREPAFRAGIALAKAVHDDVLEFGNLVCGGEEVKFCVVFCFAVGGLDVMVLGCG